MPYGIQLEMVKEDLNPYDVQPDQIWDLPEIGRVKVISITTEDAVCRGVDGFDHMIWMRALCFRNGDRLHVAGDWRNHPWKFYPIKPIKE